MQEILTRNAGAQMKHVGLLSYQWLHNGKRNRYIWYLIYTSIWAFTIYMIYFICTTFMENPTYTTLESFHYPVRELAMPGISVCNLNKISKKRAEAYAEKLAISTGINKSDIMNNVTLLGHLYDFSLPADLGTLEHFQVFLETYPDNIQGGSFDTQKVLKELTTPCHETLTDCVLHGAFWNCSDLFVTELTMEGFCCVFNYIAQRKTAEFPRIL
ncbi:unnamed protein product [Acanthoscelides obtectus]|nr:unnamed protein product [Acanthoscelides obtectus]CAK1664470.1 Sodium channel protein Nach [Acanthoscelides obtectus]